jgi:hypothetical protein
LQGAVMGSAEWLPGGYRRREARERRRERVGERERNIGAGGGGLESSQGEGATRVS